MVSTTEGCTDKILITPNQYDPTKNPSTRKPRRQFSEALVVKHKATICRLGTAKKKRKATITDNVLWSNIS